jgi:hypothetical protein
LLSLNVPAKSEMQMKRFHPLLTAEKYSSRFHLEFTFGVYTLRRQAAEPGGLIADRAAPFDS